MALAQTATPFAIIQIAAVSAQPMRVAMSMRPARQVSMASLHSMKGPAVTTAKTNTILLARSKNGAAKDNLAPAANSISEPAIPLSVTPTRKTKATVAI